ncbi:DUF7519 family protein [Natrinema salinisoli]|uniref:DUF7519 family protein n=1 Tax=Natrinema salinisoli TaxID=2878535 RepID=UPI001CF023A1|nr:hypothetical protein [Natrinema salinisoli]
MTNDALTGTGDRNEYRGFDGDESGTTRTVALETARDTLESAVRGVRRTLRQPTASDVAMLCCTLAIGLAVGTTLVGGRLAALAMGAGFAAALTTVFLASERPLVRGLGGVVAVPVAVLVSSPLLLAGVLVLTSSSVGVIAGGAVWVLVVASVAAGLVSWQQFGRGGVRRGSTGTMLATSGVVAVVVLPILPRADLRDRAVAAAADVLGVIQDELITPEGSLAVVSFTGLVLVAAVLSSRALAAVPAERLVPPDRRDALAAAVDGLRRGCSLATRAAIVLTVAAVAAPLIVEQFGTPPVTPVELRAALPAPAGDGLATLVTTPGIRSALVALAAVALGLVSLERLRGILGRGPAIVVARMVAPMVGGGLVALVLATALADPAAEADLRGILQTALAGRAPPSVLEFLTSVPPLVLVAGVLVLALSSLSSLLWTVTMLRAVRLLPGRATGAALAAGAVFALAVGLAINGRLEPAIWTTAGAFVLWDIGEYADGIRTELGRDAATMRAELVHVGGTILAGGVVAGGTIVLYRWSATGPSVSHPALAAVSVGTGLLAVVLVAWTLRG